MVQLQQLQDFQISQQKQKAVTPPPTAVPDSTQTPPTTEPEDTSSEITEQKPEDMSHDQTNLVEDTSHDQTNLVDTFPNESHDQSEPSKEIDFDEAFNSATINGQTNEDPFLPLLDDDNTPSNDKERLDTAFAPIQT